MNTPKIKFKENIKLDKWKFTDFLYRDNRGGVSFKKLILKNHPKLKTITDLSKEEAEKIIFSYVNSVYSKNEKGIGTTIKKMQNDWEKIEKDYFNTTSTFFQNTPWPKGKYIAYFSISSPMPRFLDSKTFQVGYRHNGRWKATVAHEMLHFIFFEHIRKKYTPDLTNTIEKKMNKLLKGAFTLPLWDLSEIINVILLNEKSYQNIFPYPSLPYPENEDNYKRMRILWKKSNKNIDKFLKSIEAN